MDAGYHWGNLADLCSEGHWMWSPELPLTKLSQKAY